MLQQRYFFLSNCVVDLVFYLCFDCFHFLFFIFILFCHTLLLCFLSSPSFSSGTSAVLSLNFSPFWIMSFQFLFFLSHSFSVFGLSVFGLSVFGLSAFGVSVFSFLQCPLFALALVSLLMPVAVPHTCPFCGFTVWLKFCHIWIPSCRFFLLRHISCTLLLHVHYHLEIWIFSGTRGRFHAQLGLEPSTCPNIHLSVSHPLIRKPCTCPIF